MRIYEERSTSKRRTHCPTCGNEGHMWMTCPVPAKMMELKKQGKEPDMSLYSQWQASTWGRRNDNGDMIYKDRIFRKMEMELDKQQRRKENRKAKKERDERFGIVPKKRKTSCGFCGGTDHNRRNCDIMFNFMDDLARASTNYRKKFYERLVQGQGFAEGALVAVSASYIHVGNQWTEDFEAIGIISSIDWDKVNLGLTMNNWDYRSKIKVSMVVNGTTFTVENPFKGMTDTDTDNCGKKGEIAELFGSCSGYGLQIDSVVAPSENIPSEEWFNEGHTDCWEWITKNKSLSDVACYLAPLIAKWHPSRRGRNAGKLNFRLSQYGYKRKK